MKLLKTIYPHEVDPMSPDYNYASFVPRLAVRAVVFDGGKIALVHVKNDGYYMLPGGGIDNDEEAAAALAREVCEELGFEVDVDEEVGMIITYIDRWHNKQIDRCYTARLVGTGGQREMTDFEVQAGFDLVWAADIKAAVMLMRQVTPTGRDGLLIQERDTTFLEFLQNSMDSRIIS